MSLRAGRSRVESLERRVLLDAVPVGPAFPVNTVTASVQAEPAIAMNADGRFVVAWTSPDNVGNGIFAQRFDSNGMPLGDEFRVNTYPSAYFEGGATVAMDADGDFVVAWHSWDTNGGSTHDGWGFGIYARRFNSSGTPLSGEFRVNTYTAEDQVNPAIAMDGSGDFVIVWESELQDGSGYGIYAQRYDSSGDAQGDEFRVNTFTTHNQRNASVAMDMDGDFVVAWQSLMQVGTRYQVFAQRFNAAGAPQGGEFQVSTVAGQDGEHPSAAMDDSGNFVIAWDSDNGSTIGEYPYAQRYNAAGVAQGGLIPVNTSLEGRQFTPSIAMNGSGDFAIAWYHHNGTHAPFTVRGKYFNAAGIAQGGEFIASAPTPLDAPAVGMDADGDFVVAWTGYGNVHDIFARRYTTGPPSAPVIVDEEFLYETVPHKLVFAFNQDVALSLDVNDIVVENLTAGGSVNPASVTYDHGADTATFTFPSAIPDGNYRATLLASGIFGPGGSLPADHEFTFRFLRGDATGDGIVNLADFNILATNFGTSGKPFSQGNFDYDPAGNVNLADFNILAGRFGTSLSPYVFVTRALGTTSKIPRLIEAILEDEPQLK